MSTQRLVIIQDGTRESDLGLWDRNQDDFSLKDQGDGTLTLIRHASRPAIRGNDKVLRPARTSDEVYMEGLSTDTVIEWRAP